MSRFTAHCDLVQATAVAKNSTLGRLDWTVRVYTVHDVLARIMQHL